jgi:hypothetical protein
MEALHRLASALADHETISGDQVRALVQAAGPIPGSVEPSNLYLLNQ